ncbi:MAG TPA: thiamine pyrophosphate-binding protein [Chloroflexota bacterium]|jgi:acetolactate synthase-1/2/3 large subunit|nr:thiamine pyrophosphate-binding protein [Chloroflexota bacterium]
MPRTGAHVLIAALDLHGVDTLFGVPGHGAYPIYDALNDFPAVRPFVGRNEQGATFSAEGYSRATGRVAVATAVPKAGLTNAATGIWEANDQPSRMLFLLEADPSHRSILEPICRYYARADAPSEIAPRAHELMWRLRRGRPGAAALEVPNAVLNAQTDADPRDGFEAPAAAVDRAGLADLAARLGRAERPLIVAGAPAADAPQALTRLAERLQAPVFVDGRSKGAIPDDHPLALGFSYAPARAGGRLVERSDLVLQIGHDEAVAAHVPPERLARVDWDDAVAGGAPGAHRLRGDVPALLEALAEDVPARRSGGWPTAELDEVRRSPHEYADERIPWATGVWRDLRRALPRDGLVFTDSLFGLWTARLFPAYGANTLSFPWGTGTLGHAVPAALGARRAFPDRPIVAIAGDGAFLYNPQELATMMLYRQKLVVLVANDDCYGAVRDNMKSMFGRSIAHLLRNPDFLSFGHAFGMDATRLRSTEELGDALSTALSSERSALIELPLELRPPRF